MLRLLPMLLVSASALAQPNTEKFYADYRTFGTCNTLYGSPAAKHLVLNADLAALEQVNSRLSAFARKNYSNADAQKVTTSAYMEGAALTPKEINPAVQFCRRAMRELSQEY